MNSRNTLMIGIVNVFILVLLCSPIALQAAPETKLIKTARSLFGQIPKVMPRSKNDTPSKIQLGERLYFETALSINHSQSCNSCHNILDGGAGVDNLQTSIGALGVPGRRNAPSTWNAGFQFYQNWDASAKTLEEQARSPILNPIEMALPSEKIAIKRLKNIGYEELFSTAFPNESQPLSFGNITAALAAFQRTLITQDRFDNFIAGDEQALTEPEKQGLSTFLKKGCSSCHTGPLMGGQFLMKMGVVNPYPNTTDRGRAEITEKEAHNFLFKVPILRNISKTAPFFHDGAESDLEQAVFDTGWHQLGIKLSKQEVSDISTFLGSLDNLRSYKPNLIEIFRTEFISK